MSKIKLLILLLISLFFSSCVSNHKNNNQFRIDYIGGSADGLIYSNYLSVYLKSLNLFNNSSNLTIDTSINHNQKVFITNVNNTSDREMITSNINAKIYDNNKKCKVLEYNDDVQQYYVISSNIYFKSNNKAAENIKRSNTEILTKKMVHYISRLENFVCGDE